MTQRRRHVLELSGALPGTGLLGKSRALHLSNSGTIIPSAGGEQQSDPLSSYVSTQNMIEAPLQIRPELVPPLPTFKSEVVSWVWM